MWALDRQTGQFLWANPFPYAEPNFLISDIDVKTGRTTINWDLVLKTPGEHHVICAYNTKSYWPMAYNPPRNSFYIPYIDDCLDMTSAVPAPAAAANGQRGQAAPPRKPEQPEDGDGTCRRQPAGTPARRAASGIRSGEVWRNCKGQRRDRRDRAILRRLRPRRWRDTDDGWRPGFLGRSESATSSIRCR